MGSGIAACIARAGLSLSVYDSDEAKISAATSAPLIVKNTADTILKECDLILFCVPSASQIDSVLSIAPPKSGATLIDLTSSDPRTTKLRAEKLLAENNAHQLDAAMSGGAKGAAAGTSGELGTAAASWLGSVSCLGALLGTSCSWLLSWPRIR